MTIQKSSDSKAATINQVVIEGDLGHLTAEQQTAYYFKVCETLGLNPYTKPFAYLRLPHRENQDGQWRTVTKLVLYALRDATDQLRDKRNISVVITGREQHDELYVVTAKATTLDGRTDESIGAVSIAGLKGDALANALMKGETKAKRRVTLSISGLGWLDETELATIPDAQVVNADINTGKLSNLSPSLSPPRPQSVPTITYDQLKAEVEASGMTWAQFEINVLGNKTWATFSKIKGATTQVAKNMWETWKEKQAKENDYV